MIILCFLDIHATEKEAAMRRLLLLGLMVLMAGCGSSVNVEQERTNLLALDREWAQSTKDVDTFLSYYAPDATTYPPGMPAVTGADALRKLFTEMMSAPGFSLTWTPTKADVAASGDLGSTAGTYEMSTAGATDKGKYITLWKRQPNGEWKATDDIINAFFLAPALV